MSDLMATSPQTWRDNAHAEPLLPPLLAEPPVGAPVGVRLRALHDRHTLRRQRAERVYADSRNPARGWPVAGERDVVRFVGAMVRSRRGWFTALVALNALAAVAALAVPRLLGELVDRAHALPDAELDTPLPGPVSDIDGDTLRWALSRLVGQMAMWNAAVADATYDFGVEVDEPAAAMRRRLEAKDAQPVAPVEPAPPAEHEHSPVI